MRHVLAVVMIFNLTVCIFGQAGPLDQEIGFKLVKAEYLVNTERFEDAIKELNEVIKQNPGFKNAMLLRAETKYKLAAYKGAKIDILEYINLNGITGKAASILGKSEFALNNFDPALNSLIAAAALGEKDARIHEMNAEIYESKNQKINACEQWQAAAKLGSTKGAINAKKNCGIKIDTPTEQTNTEHSKEDNELPDHTSPNQNNTANTDSTKVKDNEVLSDGNKNTETSNTTPPNTTNTSENTGTTTTVDHTSGENIELIPEEDNTVNEIIIDEELTLQIFGQGLGKRTIAEKPSILILAEKDGHLVVEICVNKDGKVDFAEFVASKSTLNQNSLVSLAIRKAKEFWFEESEYPKQCGFVKFVIKGS